MLCCIPALNFKQRVIVVFIDNSDENMFARPQQIIKPAVVLAFFLAVASCIITRQRVCEQ